NRWRLWRALALRASLRCLRTPPLALVHAPCGPSEIAGQIPGSAIRGSARDLTDQLSYRDNFHIRWRCSLSDTTASLVVKASRFITRSPGRQRLLSGSCSSARSHTPSCSCLVGAPLRSL